MNETNLPAEATAEQAIPYLLDQHGGRIYGLGLRMCGDPEEAKDLVQEVFLNAYRHWESFEGRAEPSTWLYTIAVRACRRLHRRRAGEPSRLHSLQDLLPASDEGVVDVPADGEGPLDEQLRREARETLERALPEVPIKFRLPLVLKEIAELTTPQIADVLGVKEATVKTRVHRGRLYLRKALEAKLPKKQARPADHSRQVCLDLLQAKQESLDRGVEFPLPSSELCDRCQALFATLDLAQGACAEIRQGELPAVLRRELADHIGLAS